MKVVVADFQGFHLSDGFHVKEMAINNGHQISHFILKPPREYRLLSLKEKKTVNYLEKEHHGLRFSGGYIHYNEIYSIIKDAFTGVDLIYVRGHQKQEFLEEMFRNIGMEIVPQVENMENHLWSPLRFQKKRPMCMNHEGNGPVMCSITNCKDLFDWFSNLLPKEKSFSQ